MQTTMTPDEIEDLEDMTSELVLLAGIGVSATFAASSGTLDIVSVAGAALAAFVAQMKAAQEKRDWRDRSIVVVGTTVIGSTAPSAAINYWWPVEAKRMTWHAWGLLGFIVGLIGWGLCWGLVLVLDKRREKLIERALKKLENNIP